MSGNNNSKTSTPGTARRRSPWPLAVVAALFIIVPFLTWYGTWFGRELSDEKIEEYLSDEKKPRRVQHALSQIEERMIKGDAGARRLYPRIVALAASHVPELRKTSAYLMQYDGKSEEFHAALVRLLDDSHPVVRRQAALSLVSFGDARGRPELRAMLQPYPVVSPGDGIIRGLLSKDTPVREGMLMARIERDGNRTQEVRSPVPGKIDSVGAREDGKVATGDTIFIVAPDTDFVWEALRALNRVGEAEDLTDVERYARGVEGMPERIKEQAALTVEAVKRRSSHR